MSKKAKIALATMVTAAAMASTGAQAATETATAQAEIVAGVQISENDGLDFGTVVAGAVSGMVTVSTTSNTPTCSTGLTCAGTAQRGLFTVSNAAAGYTVAITVPSTTVLRSGGNEMVATLEPSMASFVSAGADQQFYVGGTLMLEAYQNPGTYTGTYEVSADYQ